jgi:bile acid:Na+ symporter, BASS family
MAVSPVPPFLPALSAGAQGPYAIGLLAATSLLAVAFVPLVLGVLQHVFTMQLALSSTEIALLVGVTVLVPLLLRIGARTVAPTLSVGLIRPASLLAAALLIIDSLMVLVDAARGMWELVGNGTLQAMAAYSLIALVIGHVLGGPVRHNRTTLGFR